MPSFWPARNDLPSAHSSGLAGEAIGCPSGANAGQPTADHAYRKDSFCSLRRRHRAAFLSALCAAYFVISGSEAFAHCSAQDVLERHIASLTNKTDPPAGVTASVADALIPRSITIGSFANVIELRNELDLKNCAVGDSASQILARLTFSARRNRMDIDLISVSPAELGLQGESVLLSEVYTRASQLGLALAPAEAGPQLRLQYADQPVGEFLTIGMKPISVWSGESLILVVANGGAGLVLISRDAGAEAKIFSKSPIVFERKRGVAVAD